VAQQPIKTTVFLVIKNSIICSGIQSLLSQTANIKIIGEAQNKLDAKELICELCPNVLLLEFAKNESSEELKKWVGEVCRETKIILLLSDNTGASLSAAMEIGTAGYLPAGNSIEAITNAIQKAMQGEVTINQEQMEIAKQWKDNVEIKLKQLTSRENEILRLLTKGLDSKAISSLLDINVKTVAYHITNILSKLSLKSRQEATIWALRHLSDDLE
jgi:DNA-binding NarL/FixJ family response regulator